MSNTSAARLSHPKPGDNRDLAARSTEEVFRDHLRLRRSGDLEADLARNFALDVILLTANSNRRGHDAIRMSAERLRQQLGDARWEFRAEQVSGNHALLVWQAHGSCSVRCGADSFYIRHGKIQAQTIHYLLESKS